jgi:hypothetical protein
MIYRQIKSQSDCLKLQEDLEAAIKWEQDWLMKDLTQFMICSDMPKYFILYSSLLCGTLSKAFAKSIIIKSVCIFLC